VAARAASIPTAIAAAGAASIPTAIAAAVAASIPTAIAAAVAAATGTAARAAVATTTAIKLVAVAVLGSSQILLARRCWTIAQRHHEHDTVHKLSSSKRKPPILCHSTKKPSHGPGALPCV